MDDDDHDDDDHNDDDRDDEERDETNIGGTISSSSSLRILLLVR